MYSVTYVVFDSKEMPVARGNAPTLERAKQLADAVKSTTPVRRTVIETNGITVIRHRKNPGGEWVEQEQTGRRAEQFQRPARDPK